ncbi:septal ring lytic transglycosylase RlpA family protein [Pseudomonas sp. gcc21]|uniref:septal ring lytic transglycosylase RlpA family protein n=1 Tax=Pseudomonas sp. gcc21 TaxID=2726989 RepID=UPI00145216CC|nr:septal ring lytic transglycosylase RlpA family protein [Pseudomonas sp. gcc21]QJD58937.1 septal ring lytic transglycosylase RlpA family protein [Pseudomonas sp. gcc21]
MTMRTSSRMRIVAASLLLGVLAGCSSAPQPGQGSGMVSKPAIRPMQDGAPTHIVDVSTIPDAIPVPHTGRYKATPYKVLGKYYTPMQDGSSYRETGPASWYGTKFHGQLTANGEDYDLYGMTAAHKTLPLPTYVRVTNLENKRTVIVRVNDRGPFYSDRIIDLSYAAAKKLGFAEKGTAQVLVEGIDPVAWQQQNNPGYLVKKNPPIENLASAPGQQMFLQVGAFSSSQAAEQLRVRLQNALNTTVFVTPVQQPTGTFHRVRLGPVASHDEAQKLIEALRVANLGNATLVTSN